MRSYLDPKSPLVSAAVRRIRDGILDGEFSVGAALPAERDLADRLGVGRPVVRQAIAALGDEGWLLCKPRCRPVVVDRTQDDRPLGQEAWHISAWLWPSASEYAATQILAGLQRGMSERPDLKLVIGSATGDDWEGMVASERRFLNELATDPTAAGAVLWYVGGQDNLDVLSRVVGTGLPVVFVDREAPEGIHADHVGTDNLGSAEEAVRHLLALGHTRIGCLTNMDRASSVVQRVAGWRRALGDAGIEPGPGWLQRTEVTPDLDMWDALAAALDRMLAGPQPPTALFAINDSLALQAERLLVGRGVRIPHDFSVVGFDGMMRWMPGGGHLTTAVQDFRRMGELSARLVLERTSGRAPRAIRHVLLPAPLSLQGSTKRVEQLDVNTGSLKRQS